jgi:hypothetical protein
MGFVFPPHNPEDHRQTLFANLESRYGTDEEQRKAELWLSVALDDCALCKDRLIWPLAKDVGAVAALAKVFKLLATSEPPPEENDERLLEVTRLTSVADRGDLVVEIANDFAARRGDHRAEHGVECEGCSDRRDRWGVVRRRSAA